MTTTTIGTNNAMTQKKWSSALAYDQAKQSYFEGRFIGDSDNHIIQKKNELEGAEGDKISFDLCVQLRNKPTYGDARVEGSEEQLKFFSDQVVIDQVRHSVSLGGRMSRKRIAHDLRKVGKDRLSGYFAKLMDEFLFMYLAGSRGMNEDFIEDTSFTGFAGNAFTAPDTDHILYAGSATSKASLVAADKLAKLTIEKAANKAVMMQARNPNTANMVPVSNGAEDQYITVMTPDQAFDLRTADTTGWMDIQKAAITNQGKNNPIFLGGLGMINNVVLHSHRSVVRFNDYGAGANVPAARALFMGRQAAVIAYGDSGGGMRFSWKESLKDYDNEPTIASGAILGMKKTTFNGADFGVIAIDTAAAPAS